MDQTRLSMLKPAQTVNSLSAINLNKMWENGYRGIILDLDNTITSWHQDTISEEALVFVNLAREKGYKIYLVSNAKKKRTKAIADKLGIGFAAPALKPLKRGYIKALRELGLHTHQIIAVGDQIFTDILGGNLIGCYTILVPPLSNIEFFGTKILRFLEVILGCRGKS